MSKKKPVYGFKTPAGARIAGSRKWGHSEGDRRQGYVASCARVPGFVYARENYSVSGGRSLEVLLPVASGDANFAFADGNTTCWCDERSGIYYGYVSLIGWGIKRIAYDHGLWLVQESEGGFTLRDNTGVVTMNSSDEGWVIAIEICRLYFSDPESCRLKVEEGNWVDGDFIEGAK